MASSPRTGIRIAPDGTTLPFTFTPETALEVFQQQIGGYIEPVPLTDQIVLYADEDGLAKYQTRDWLNWAAMTLVARYHGSSGPLVGPIIAVGEYDDNSDNASLSAETVMYITRIAQEARPGI